MPERTGSLHRPKRPDSVHLYRRGATVGVAHAHGRSLEAGFGITGFATLNIQVELSDEDRAVSGALAGTVGGRFIAIGQRTGTTWRREDHGRDE